MRNAADLRPRACATASTGGRWSLVHLGLRISLFSSALLGCGGDASCVFYPCPPPMAATIIVSAAGAPAGIPGLMMDVNGAGTGNSLCSQGPTNTCTVFGGRGSYHVELRAPGYIPAVLDLTITGADAGCNTCGHVDSQTVSVTMQPAT